MVFPGFLTDRHDITEILLKVALNTITLTLNDESSLYWQVDLMMTRGMALARKQKNTENQCKYS